MTMLIDPGKNHRRGEQMPLLAHPAGALVCRLIYAVLIIFDWSKLSGRAYNRSSLLPKIS